MARKKADRRTRIHWRRVAAVLALFFLSGLAAAYWMLAGLDLNRFKPEIIEAVKSATGRELTVGGDIQLQIGLHPTLAVENVRYQNAPWGSRNDMLRLRRLEFQIAAWPLLFGVIDIRRIILVSPDLLLETRADGEWNLPRIQRAKEAQPSASGGFVYDGLRHLAFATARVEGGRLAWRSGRSGKILPLNFRTIKAGMTDLESPIQLTIEAGFGGRPLRIAGSIGRLFQLLDETRQWPLDLSLTAGGMRASVSGTIRSVGAGRGLDLFFRVEGDSFALLNTAFPGWLPEVEKQFSAAFRLTDPADGRLRFSELEMTAGKNDISGWIEIEPRSPRIRMNADLHSRRIFLDSVPKGRNGGSGGAKSREKIFSGQNIDFRFLQKADAEIHMTVDRLQTPVLETETVDIHLAIENGEATLRPAMVQIGDGYAEGRASLRQGIDGAWLSLQMTMRDLPAERVLTVISRPPALTGKMDADIRLLGGGRSPAELMADLDGKVFWIMGKGKIHTRHIDTLGGEMAGSLIRLLNPGSQDEARTTDLNCMVAEIEVVRGIAHCRGLLLDTDRTTIAGEGEIDLATEEIDISMDPSPKRGVGLKGLGGLTLSLGELGNPFKLGGTLASPQLTLDTAGAAITIGKAFGGFTLAGPFGLAAALADFSSAGDNPCLEAIENFQKKNAEKIKP